MRPVGVGRIGTTENALFSFSGWALPLVLTAVVTPIVVGALGTDEYGIYALVLGVASSLAALLSPTRTLVRYIALQGPSRRTRAGRLLGAAVAAVAVAGALTAFVLALTAPRVVDDVLQIDASLQPVAARALTVAGLGIPFMLMAQLLAAAPQGLQRFDVNSRLVLLVAVLTVGGNGVLAAAGFELLTLVAWASTAAAIGCVVSLRAARRLLPALTFSAWRRIGLLLPHLGFSAGVLASQVPGQVLLLFERVWIVRTVGAGDFTYYAVSMILGLSLHAAIASLVGVLLPVAAEAYGRDDLQRLRDLYARALKLAAAIVVPVVAMLVVAGDTFLELWLGLEFARRASTVLALHATAFGILALVAIPWQIAEARGRPRWNLALALSWLVIGGGLLIWATPRYGIVGAAAARAVSMALVPLYGARLEHWLFGRLLGRFWARALTILVAGASVAVLTTHTVLSLTPVTWWGLAGASTAGVAGFVAILSTLRYFTPAERSWLSARTARLWWRPASGHRPGDDRAN